MCKLSLQESFEEKAEFLHLFDSVDEESQKAESPSGDEQDEATDDGWRGTCKLIDLSTFQAYFLLIPI